jgi:hypothetical protein
MKPQFQHQIVTSFTLWLDNLILSKGDAYQNITSTFYLQTDERLDPNYLSFASPHKQWVNDSDIKGAKIIEGVTVDNYFIKRTAQGIQYDFDNGRVLIPRHLASPSAYVEGLYSVKDFNIYITDQTEEELLIETKFDKNSRFDQDIFQGIKPYDQVVPAIFCSYEQGENIPFAFGGEDITESRIRCVIFAENSFQLDGAFSIIKDSNLSTIANVGYDEHPLNEFGDLKFGNYDYKDLSDRYYDFRNSQSSFYIEKVKVSKLNDRVAKKAHPGLYIGFADFTLRAHRFPRAPLVEPVASRAPAVQNIPLAPYELTLITMQKPFAPFHLKLNQRLPYAPYGLYLTSQKHERLQAGEVANVVVLEGGKLLIRLDGSSGQVAFLSILGQSIKIGSSASDNLIWDGFEFTSVGEKITRTIAGANFQIEWVGRGSQIFEITRLSGGSFAEFDVSVYIPCSADDYGSLVPTPYLETAEATPTRNRNPMWQWTAISEAVSYEIEDIVGDTISTTKTEYIPNKILADGTYSIKVRAVDSLGRKSDFSNEVSYAIDTTAPLPGPVITLTSLNTDRDMAISWADASTDSTKEYTVSITDDLSIDTQSFDDETTTSTTFTKELTAGRYRTTVTSKDSLGNKRTSDELVFSQGIEFDIVRTQISSVPIASFSVYQDGEQAGRNELPKPTTFAINSTEQLILRPLDNDLLISDLVKEHEGMKFNLDDGTIINLKFLNYNEATPYYPSGKYAFFALSDVIPLGRTINSVELFMKA